MSKNLSQPNSISGSKIYILHSSLKIELDCPSLGFMSKLHSSKLSMQLAPLASVFCDVKIRACSVNSFKNLFCVFYSLN